MTNCRKFIIFSYAIGTLFAFSSSSLVRAAAPQDEKIAFVSKRDGNAEIYIMNPDGSEQVNLTQHPAEDYDPAWSPNGDQILFSSNRTDGIFDLYLMDADGTNVQKVFGDNMYRRNPAWSPDGEHIAYAQADPGKAILRFGARFAPAAELMLHIATPNGTSVEKLTKGDSPSWSPDSRELVFIVTGLKHTPLGLFDVQTRTEKVLHPKELPWTASPVWSLQGDKIAFAKLSVARFNEHGGLAFQKGSIYIANPDGTGGRQVTDGLSAYNPTWAPQGNQIIYNDRAGFLQLYKVDLKGGTPMQLTHEGSNSRPDWFNPNAFSVSPAVRSLTTMWGEIKTD